MSLSFQAISYTNIWPFRDQTITVRFPHGSYLIKAPIGSGKSFLFFDGPTFALYKKTSRPLLNMQSKKWSIAAWRSFDDQHYLTIRELNKTPKGETIKSSLYQIDNEHIQNIQEKLPDSIIQYEMASHIPEWLSTARQYGKAIDAKNEKDIQDMIQSILPPLSVYEGTHMLMQDSINIFELPPQQRIDIFKNIFWLLGIDEAKEKISEEKRSIAAMIKTRQDSSRFDSKAQEYSSYLIEKRPITQTIFQIYESHNTKKEWYQTRWTLISERSLLQDHISIEALRLPTYLPEIHDILSYIETQQHRSTSLKTSIDNITKEIDTLWKSRLQAEKNIQDDTKTLHELQQKVQNYDTHKVTNAQQEIDKNESDLNTRYETLPRDQRENATQKLLTWSLPAFALIDLPASIEARNISALRSLLQAVKAHAKTLQWEKTLIEQTNNSWQQQKNTLQTEHDRQDERITTLSKSIESQKLFHCDKIGGNCPYIDLINTATFKTLQTQLQWMIADRDHLNGQIKQLMAPRHSYTGEQIDQAILALREWTQAVDRKKIEEVKEIEQTKKWEKEKLHYAFQLLVKEQGTLQSINEQITSLESKIQQLTLQQEESIKIEELKRHDLHQYQQELTSFPSNPQLTQHKESLMHYQQTIDRLQLLLDEYKQSKQEINKLKEEEKILGDLYQIFSKELLFLVVRNSLPILQEIINSRLSTVVDYQIAMDIDKTSTTSDKIELVVTVQDDKGVREIKSLSGWQKVVLKLAWMMAVSVFNRSQMLFLDETVNNLDNETVAKVADLLTQFIEWSKGTMQVYLVSHSSQIQEMPIWDGLIEIQKITK